MGFYLLPGTPQMPPPPVTQELSMATLRVEMEILKEVLKNAM